MKKSIEKAANLFLKKIDEKPVKIISHHDTDGITSAAILAQTLKELDKRFSIKIVKNLERDYVKNLSENETIILLDLGSSLLDELEKKNTDVFVIDHHQVTSEFNKGLTFINPHLFDEEEISGSGLTYLFCKEIIGIKRDLASLAIIGMVGDMLGREISKWNNEIINDAEIEVKKGLLIYPSTRPINKALEYSSFPFIPGVTGDSKGVFELLTEAGIKRQENGYKNLLELNEQEISKLITGVLLRTKKQENLIGNIYLVKFFNKVEDARELSAMINACSRIGFSDVALGLCLSNVRYKKMAEEIYVDYKQHLISALNFAEKNLTQGKGYVLLNSKDMIKDTMIGTVASILSMSKNFDSGKIIVAMSYDNDKIKVSARIAGRDDKEKKDVREILSLVTREIGGECGGHKAAAGCLIPKQKENKFIEKLEEVIGVNVMNVN